MQPVARPGGLTRDSVSSLTFQKCYDPSLAVKPEGTSYLGDLKYINSQSAEELLSVDMIGKESSTLLRNIFSPA